MGRTAFPQGNPTTALPISEAKKFSLEKLFYELLMIHPWQSNLTSVSKAELQQEEKNHPGLSVIAVAALNTLLLASLLQSDAGCEERSKYNLPRTPTLPVGSSLRGVAIIMLQVVPPPGFSVAQSSYHSACLQGFNYLLEMKCDHKGKLLGKMQFHTNQLNPGDFTSAKRL